VRAPRNGRLVRQPDRVQTRMILLLLGAGLLILLPLLANIWGHAEAVRLGYRMEAARKVREARLEANRMLRAEHAALRDLGRIQKLATEKLGLIPRDPVTTVVVTVVAPPGGEDQPRDGERELVLASVGGGGGGQGGRP
jgi:cell division protein FtsL